VVAIRKLQSVQEQRHGVRECSRSWRAIRIQYRRIAESGKVERDHIALAGEAVAHRAPHVAVCPQGMQEDECGSGAAPVVREAHGGR